MAPPRSIGFLLHHCTNLKSFRHGLSLHAHVLKSGMQSDIVVSNHVVNLYAKCGNLGYARQVFDEMPDRNLVSWSAMISGYDQFGEPFLAVDLFARMRLVPNEFVYASVISACASLAVVTEGQQVHAHSLKFGCESISFVSNALITMYMKCARCSDAWLVHQVADEPNAVSYNALVAGFVENQEPEKGFELFKLMRQQGFMPDKFSFVGVLGSCTNSDDFQRGALLHCLTIKLNLDSSTFTGNVLITMYSKLNLVEEAEKVFRLIDEKDMISWHTFVTACSHCCDHDRALRAFKEMVREYGLQLDDLTFASALAACSGLASIRHGKQIHAHLIRTRMHLPVGVENALVNMYAKCGSIGNAYDIFCKMIDCNVVSWNTIIAGYGNHGLGGRALELFEKMKTIGVSPDPVTFVSLLTACNHAGLVDEGLAYFNCMEETYGISPNVEHLTCLVDLLGRAGRIREAEEYMMKSSFRHDPIVLGTLLSACRLHGDVIIGERLARRLLELQPIATSPYVLLSNLYAVNEMWDGVAEARKLLKVSGIKKEPGHSLIEVNGTFEKFTMRDFAHLQMEEMKEMLRTLNWALGEVCLII